MNPEQKRNLLPWCVAGLFLLTLTFWTISSGLGHAIQEKHQRLVRDNRALERRISSVAQKITGHQENSTVLTNLKVNPAELYSILVDTAEETGMIIDNFSWHKGETAQAGQDSAQSSANGDGLNVEINIKGNYRNFTQFLFNYSKLSEYEFISKITLTAIDEADCSLKATLIMHIPN